MFLQALSEKYSNDNPASFTGAQSTGYKTSTAEEIYIDLGFSEVGDDYGLEDKKELLAHVSLRSNLKSGILNSSGVLDKSFSQLNSRNNTGRKFIDNRLFLSPQRQIVLSSPTRTNGVVGPRYDDVDIGSPKPIKQDNDAIIEEEDDENVYDRTAKVSFVENNVPISEFFDKNGELWKQKPPIKLIPLRNESAMSGQESDKFTIDNIPTSILSFRKNNFLDPCLDFNNKKFIHSSTTMSNVGIILFFFILKDEERTDLAMLRAIFYHDVKKVQQLLTLSKKRNISL